MNTAEKIIQRMVEEMPFDLNKSCKPYIREAMEIYAKQVAQEALEQAAKKYEGITMKDGFGCICDVPRAIKTTPIITP